MNKYPDHTGNILALKRIEGQVRGVQKMIEERKYCVDILNQIHAVMRALAVVEDKVLELHLGGCVSEAIRGKSGTERAKKLKEMLELIRQFRKL
ncbi:MAG: metal-sensitive transcriptional regulator [Candidatus Omnitrophica bacterium]|nr:metal-sensitive transcriptional regulator [Candidatus Omnitrophota bacterium]